jgi:hypothetical protein
MSTSTTASSSNEVKKDVDTKMHIIEYNKNGFCKECNNFLIMASEDDFDDIYTCIECKRHVAYNDGKIKTKCIFCNPPTNEKCSHPNCKNQVLFYKWHIPYYYCKLHALEEYGTDYIAGLIEIPFKCMELISKNN